MKVFVNPWTLVEVVNLSIDALDAFNPSFDVKKNINRGNLPRHNERECRFAFRGLALSYYNSIDW